MKILSIGCPVLLVSSYAVAGFAGQHASLTNGNSAGSVCQKVSGGVLTFFSDDALTNSSKTQDMVIDCPVSSSGNPLTATSTGPGISYIDDSPGAITCTLFSEAADSTAVHQVSASSVGDDGTYRALVFPASPAFENGHRHIRCTIPPRDAGGRFSYIKGFAITDDFIDLKVRQLGYQTLPGSNCRKRAGNGSLAITGDGAIYNAQVFGAVGGGLSAECPSVTFPNPDGTTSKAVTKVWYLDDSGSADVGCTMLAEDDASNSSSQRTLTSTFNDNFYHSFDFSGANAISTFAGGFVHTRCGVPTLDSDGAASYIVGYSFSPRDPVDVCPGANCQVTPGLDERRAPGSACIPVTGNPTYGTDGSVTNTGGTVVVDCPILQNSLQSSDGTPFNPNSSKLWYTDDSTSDITCIYSTEDSNTDARSELSVSSHRDDAARDSMTFSSPFLFGGGYSHIRCTIPPPDASGNRSTIFGYAGI